MKYKYLAALAILIAFSGCTKNDDSLRVLQAAGYKNINVKGYVFFGCDKNDVFHTGFTATGANNQPVSGVVCSGWLKGNTIRLD